MITYEKKIEVKSVMFEITQACNCNCKFCYNSSGNRKENMDVELFKQIIKSLQKMGVNRIALSGGEPLLHPQFDKMLEEVLADHIRTTLISNGLAIDDRCLKLLLDNQNLYLQLSLDGADAKTDDGARVKGHFENCNEIMAYLSEHGFRHGYIRMTINKRNMNECRGVFEIGCKYQFVPVFSFVQRAGRAAANWNEYRLDEDDKIRVSRELRGLYKDREKWMLQRMDRNEFQRISQFFTGYCSLMKEKLISSPLIKVNGDVQVCQRLYGQEFCLGNVFRQPLENLLSLENVKMKNLIKLAKLRYFKLSDGACSKCLINDRCGKGCMADSVDNTDIFTIPADCTIHKDISLTKMIDLMHTKDMEYL